MQEDGDDFMEKTLEDPDTEVARSHPTKAGQTAAAGSDNNQILYKEPAKHKSYRSGLLKAARTGKVLPEWLQRENVKSVGDFFVRLKDELQADQRDQPKIMRMLGELENGHQAVGPSGVLAKPNDRKVQPSKGHHMIQAAKHRSPALRKRRPRGSEQPLRPSQGGISTRPGQEGPSQQTEDQDEDAAMGESVHEYDEDDIEEQLLPARDVEDDVEEQLLPARDDVGGEA
ncbi:hypothetical protein VPNG_04217 [Cytospora leucostoma]|uniref:Uncharacterized protein n=1 Tax=Cytospora leucostoma TaxID=1230097 RepID=A0A423XDN1_9PEZI|nr:hypothetical protein VPNG_04217 [Cytospora leucostoma]